MHTTCRLCGRPSGDDAYTCTTCADTATTALRRVTDGLADELDDRIAKQATRPNGPRARNADTPLPIDLRASDARTHLRTTLVGWVRAIHDDGTTTPLPADTLPAMAAWLIPVIGWLRHRDYGSDAIEEITAAVQHAVRAVDVHIPLDYSGQCPHCGRPVYAPAGAVFARCREDDCGGVVADVAAAKLAHLRRIDNTRMTPLEASAALARAGWSMTPSAIRGHAARGNLVRAGTRVVHTRGERPGVVRRAVRVPVYRLGDIINLAVQAAAKKERVA